MAAGSTYTPISTTTLGSAQSSVTFSSFSGYTDLVIVCANLKNAVQQTPFMQFNSDTGTNYSSTWILGNGSSASSSRLSNSSSGILIGDYNIGMSSTVPSTAIIQIQNYSNTTTYKSTLGRYNLTTTEVYAIAGLWRSTSAITSIALNAGGSSNWSSGATFTLYGILAA